MSTLTSRLKLLKAALSDPANYVTYVADAFDKIDAAAGLTVCTSTTRPASPYVGQWVLETDTNRRAHWDGTGWKCLTSGQANGTTNAFGDFNISGLGYNSINSIVLTNADQAARGSMIMGLYQPFPSGAGTPSVKCWTDAGVQINAGAVRINYFVDGYLS